VIDLSSATEGTFGEGSWFSDLFFSAVRTRFSGGVLVHAETGLCTLFFKNGAPVHAGGAGFREEFLGQLLMAESRCSQSAIDAALAEQERLGPGAALLGTLLVANAGVSTEDVRRLVKKQTELRMRRLMGLEGTKFQAAPGEDQRIRELGVKLDPWGAFFGALESSAADAELRKLSNDLLGQAVQVNQKRLPTDYEPSRDEKRVLAYLTKPRKPDQLERALKNRRFVRGFLRGLELLNALDLFPAKKGIPIPKATLLKGQMGVTNAEPMQRASTPLPRSPSRPPRSPSKPRVNPNHPIVKEVDALHKALKEKNHFELLGATDKTSPSDLRGLFTNLAKKYHPDAFPMDVPDASKEKAREITAALNDAYQTLTNDEKRAEYVALLADDRIKGDARKAELIREAEVKSQMGVVMLKKREYQKAREFFRFAMEADDSNGAYKAFFGWAMFADPKFDRDEAMKKAYPLMLEALKASPKDANIHYYLGRILKEQDKPAEALHHFREALRADRKHTDAEREYRLLKRRQNNDDDPGSGSALSRLFKRS
jgi:curved DNA-binding protein CbpA